MNIIQIILFFNYIVNVLSLCRINLEHNMRVIGIKMIILNRMNKKRYVNLIDNIKRQYKKYHEKSIGIFSNIMIEYEKIPDDEKKILELIISNIL